MYQLPYFFPWFRNLGHHKVAGGLAIQPIRLSVQVGITVQGVKLGFRQSTTVGDVILVVGGTPSIGPIGSGVGTSELHDEGVPILCVPTSSLGLMQDDVNGGRRRGTYGEAPALV